MPGKKRREAFDPSVPSAGGAWLRAAGQPTKPSPASTPTSEEPASSSAAAADATASRPSEPVSSHDGQRRSGQSPPLSCWYARLGLQFEHDCEHKLSCGDRSLCIIGSLLKLLLLLLLLLPRWPSYPGGFAFESFSSLIFTICCLVKCPRKLIALHHAAPVCHICSSVPNVVLRCHVLCFLAIAYSIRLLGCIALMYKKTVSC